MKCLASLAAVCLALLVAAGCTGPQRQASAMPNLTDLPPGWVTISEVVASPQVLASLSQRLGGRISELSNTIFRTDEGQQLQINVFGCPSSEDADRIFEKVTAGRGGPSDAVIRCQGDHVIEFAGQDMQLIRHAAFLLGLKPKEVEQPPAAPPAP